MLESQKCTDASTQSAGATPCRPGFSRLPQLISIFLCMVVLAACDGNYLVWSTDGKLAAIIGSKGLRVSDAEGTISPVLVDRAGMFRWLPQEHQGVVVGFDYVRTWAELKPVLTNEQIKQIVQDAALLRRKVFTYHGDKKKFEESATHGIGYPLQAALYLRANSSVDFEKLALKKWPGYAAIRVPVFSIKSSHLDTQAAKTIKVIDRGIDEIVELRVSPNGKYLACVKHRRPKETNYICLFSMLNSEKLLNVCSDTACYPDWSSDSKTLFYSRVNAVTESKTLQIPDLHEGGLFKLEITDGNGSFLTKYASQRLANLIFDIKSPVRSLRDGRVLFLSRAVRYPEAVRRTQSVSLFAYSAADGGRVDELVKKDKDMTYFEPSPEQDCLAYCLYGGTIWVSKINGSDPVEVCNGKDFEPSGILPQWRNNQELSYDAKSKSSIPGKSTYAVMLWSRNGNRELSKSWSKDAISEVSVHRDLFQDAIGKIIEDMDRSAERRTPKPSDGPDKPSEKPAAKRVSSQSRK